MYEKQNFTDGSVLEAEHLNHMETGIAEAHDALPQKLTRPATAQVGDYLRIKAIGADGTMEVEAVPAPTGGNVDLTGYATEVWVQELLAEFPTFKIEVVQELPAVGAEKIIYLVPFADDSGSYLEYLYINGAWEVVGSGKDSGENANGMTDDERRTLINVINAMDAFVGTDGQKLIDDFNAAWGVSGGETPDEPGTPDAATYTISYELVNVSSSNRAASVSEGASFNATLTAADGYTLDGATVSVTMGGTDITANAYSDGVISIAAVTGNVEIMVSAVQIEQEIEAVLPTDGLMAYFDLRNLGDKANVTVGTTKGVLATQGSGALYSWTSEPITSSDEYGAVLPRSLLFDPNGQSAEYDMGTEFTVVVCTRGGVSGWHMTGSNTVYAQAEPVYITTDGTAKAAQTSVTGDKTGYNTQVYCINGNIETMYLNAEKIAEYAGDDYDGFVRWLAVPAVGTIWNNGSTVAAALYNRVLTETEIVEVQAFMKSLEVTA